MEPHTLVLKGHKWYLYAHCCLRREFRLFKVSRMKDIVVESEEFLRREVRPEEIPWDREWYSSEKTVDMVVRFDKRIKFMVEEWFGIDSLEDDENGNCIVRAALPENEWLYSYIMSLGDRAEVLEPAGVRERIRETAAGVLSIYLR